MIDFIEIMKELSRHYPFNTGALRDWRNGNGYDRHPVQSNGRKLILFLSEPLAQEYGPNSGKFGNRDNIKSLLIRASQDLADLPKISQFDPKHYWHECYSNWFDSSTQAVRNQVLTQDQCENDKPKFVKQIDQMAERFWRPKDMQQFLSRFNMSFIEFENLSPCEWWTIIYHGVGPGLWAQMVLSNQGVVKT